MKPNASSDVDAVLPHIHQNWLGFQQMGRSCSGPTVTGPFTTMSSMQNPYDSGYSSDSHYGAFIDENAMIWEEEEELIFDGYADS